MWRIELPVGDVTCKHTPGYCIWSTREWNATGIGDAEGALTVGAIGRIREPWTTKPVVERNSEWKAD